MEKNHLRCSLTKYFKKIILNFLNVIAEENILIKGSFKQSPLLYKFENLPTRCIWIYS